jgi:hypothetical protein
MSSSQHEGSRFPRFVRRIVSAPRLGGETPFHGIAGARDSLLTTVNIIHQNRISRIISIGVQTIVTWRRSRGNFVTWAILDGSLDTLPSSNTCSTQIVEMA